MRYTYELKVDQVPSICRSRYNDHWMTVCSFIDPTVPSNSPDCTPRQFFSRRQIEYPPLRDILFLNPSSSCFCVCSSGCVRRHSLLRHSGQVLVVVSLRSRLQQVERIVILRSWHRGFPSPLYRRHVTIDYTSKSWMVIPRTHSRRQSHVLTMPPKPHDPACTYPPHGTFSLHTSIAPVVYSRSAVGIRTTLR